MFISFQQLQINQANESKRILENLNFEKLYLSAAVNDLVNLKQSFERDVYTDQVPMLR